MPYGDKDLGQHCLWWFVAWWHHTVIWTNLNSSQNSSVAFLWVQPHEACSRYQWSHFWLIDLPSEHLSKNTLLCLPNGEYDIGQWNILNFTRAIWRLKSHHGLATAITLFTEKNVTHKFLKVFIVFVFIVSTRFAAIDETSYLFFGWAQT